MPALECSLTKPYMVENVDPLFAGKKLVNGKCWGQNWYNKLRKLLNLLERECQQLKVDN